MTMDQALLIRQKWNGRRFNGTTSMFSVPRRAMGTSDVACALWFRPFDERVANLMRTYTPTGFLGWDVLTTTATKRIVLDAGNGSVKLQAVSGNNAYTVGAWNFLVVNIDRSGLISAYVNNMATAKITLDVSSAVALDWAQGTTVWGIGGLPGSYFFSGYMKHITHIIGHLFTEGERNELYNAGAGKRFATLSTELATVMASDDYWDIRRTGGNEANQATAARPLTWTA